MIPTDLEITLEFLDSPTEVEFYAVAGAPGHDGADGHTPVITASKQGNTTTISVDGNPVAQILDGVTGAKGDKGDKGDPGQDGAKGDKGDTGAKGDKGDTGAQGIQGIQGEKGDIGAKGDKGDKGDTGATGAAGQDGHTPVKGTDYWTAADKAEIVEDVLEEIDIPTIASGEQVKGGSASSAFIAPSVEDAASFYGLAKAAGDTSQSASSNTVGTYTDAAKVAIQKMLGIYEAPWELIREDTFTNETEASYEIAVDSNGQAFELTDAFIQFEAPKQSTESKFKDSGAIDFYLSDGTRTGRVRNECNGWTQAANASAHGCVAKMRQDGNLLEIFRVGSNTPSNNGGMSMRYGEGFNYFDSTDRVGLLVISIPVWLTKVRVVDFTGTGHYKLYGKRKWQ